MDATSHAKKGGNAMQELDDDKEEVTVSGIFKILSCCINVCLLREFYQGKSGNIIQYCRKMALIKGYSSLFWSTTRL